MPWNEIKLNISANMDFGDAKQQIGTIKEGIDSLKTSMSDMPNVSNILNSSFERSATVVDALNDKLNKLQNKQYNSDEERLALERGANNNILELNAMRDVQFGGTSYSTRIAQQWFGDLPSAVQHQFDVIAPQLTNIIRGRLSSLSKNGSSILTKEAGQIASELTGGANSSKMDPLIRSLLTKHHLSGTEAEFQLDKMIQYLIPSIAPANMNKEYQRARYGGIRRESSAELYTGKPVDLFPESFKETFKSKGKTFNSLGREYQNMVLSDSYRKELDNLLKTNPVAVKAALESGISRRNEKGILETQDEITRYQWEGFRKALYDDLLVRVSGYKGNALDAYKATGKDQKTLMQRLTSSSSGRAMLAMQDIEQMENPEAWTKTTGSGKWSESKGEGKRIQDQLVVSKYSPFTGSGAALGDPRSVTIQESHNTRLLGGGKWKNNQDVSDTIRIVSLAGYDEKNPEHQKFLESLFNPNGTQLGNAKFIAQSIHGTGQDTIIRMIEQGAYNRVNEQEAQWIKNHPDEAVRGIRGTYWGGFDDAEIARLVANGIGGDNGITAKKYGKHLEMLNKAWTNTSELGLNIDGKRFAVVDTSRFKEQLGNVSPGDGGAFFASSVMPHSGQFRGGIGLKGSAFVFEGNDLKAFGRKTGMLDEQGRLMMPGPNGELFDVSGYQGFIPLDVVKNQGVLKDENGNFVSGDIASRRFTALLQRHPLSYHADYDLDKVTSDNLGTQMASFMMFSPELRQHQIEMAMKRMQELDTEEGQLKYVFGNKEDYLSRKINPLFGGDSQLLATTEARSRIDNMRASLFNDLIAGKYINFEDDQKIANLRAAASPLATMILANGTEVPDSVVTKARGFLDKDANARLSDQDIRDMIVLPKGKVIDFNRKDEPDVAVVRSPTGFGNMYYATNLAKDAEPIYKGFGISTSTGMYVSEQDREKLQGMDFDADEVKAIYDKELAQAVQASLSKMGEYVPSDIEKKGIVYTPEQLKNWSSQMRLQAERSVTATMPMGTGSSGIRIMQLDYSKPENQVLVRAAQRMAGIYDVGSTTNKTAETFELGKDDPVWKALGLGKEYTKFSEKRTDLFKFDEGMIVSPNHPNAVSVGNGTYIDSAHPDVFKASNGQYINMRALRDMKIDEINLPSRYMSNHLMAIATANQLYRTGNVDPTQMDAIFEAADKQLGYGDAGPARQNLMRTVRTLQHQFGTGERAYISNDEGLYLQSLINAAAAELTLSADEYKDPTTGKYMLDGKAFDKKEQLVKAQEARYGIRTARNAIDQFGMLERDLVQTFGDDFTKKYQNVTDSIGSTLSVRALELENEEEALNEQISEAQEAVNQSNKGRKKTSKSRKTTRSATKTQAEDPELKALREGLGLERNANVAAEIQKTQEELDRYNKVIEFGRSRVSTYTEADREADNINRTKFTSRLEKLKAYQERLDLANMTPEEKALRELTQRKEQLSQERALNTHMLENQGRFNQLMSDARAYQDELWKDQRGKENKLNDEKTLAERQYNYLNYRTRDQLLPLEQLEKELKEDTAYDTNNNLQAERNGMLTQIANAKNAIRENMQKSFTNGIMLDAKQLEDDITKQLNGFGTSKQKEALNKYDERILQQQNGINWMQERLNKGLVDSAYQKQYEDAIKNANQSLANAQAARDKIATEFTNQNGLTDRSMLEALQIKQGLRSKNSLSVISASRKQEISTLRKQIDNQHREGLLSQNDYENMSSGLDQLEKRANPLMIGLGQGAKVLKTEFKSTFGYLNQMFTRRLFQSAISETTNFVKQFDASMNTIQMITLKTDEQISTLGNTLIDKAKEMKISVAEITQSAATLYRQGLNDQEVDERLGVISKFSKVSGTKVDAATKLITVAMNTGLVENAQTAADIVTALGDNAATNAAEIEKGIEKAGAAAAADGTSFAELSSMLTAITSTTQIGGNVAGRTLNTIFGRMNKIGTNELIYDENGNAVSGSAIAKLLEAEGIKMYDENGNKRSSFETLYALSQKWEGMSDARQQQLANAIAGTRQYSNFAAIMSGMAEGKVDQYLQLAGESEGITNKKYEIYTKSLSASLTDLKNTWDGLVNDMTDSGALGGFVSTLTNMVQGVNNLTGSMSGLGAAMAGVIPMMMLMGGIKSGSLVGLGVAAIGAAGLYGLSKKGEEKNDQEIYQSTLDEINRQYNSKTSDIQKARELSELGKSKTKEQNEELADIFGRLSVNVEYTGNTKEDIKNEQKLLDQAAKEADNKRINQLRDASSELSLSAKEQIEEIDEKYNSGAYGENENLSKYFVYDENGNLDTQKTRDKIWNEQYTGANAILSVPLLGDLLELTTNPIRHLMGKDDFDKNALAKYNKDELADMFWKANQGKDIKWKDQNIGSWGIDKWLNFIEHIGDKQLNSEVEPILNNVVDYMASESAKQKKQTEIDDKVSELYASSFAEMLPDLDQDELNHLSKYAAQELRERRTKDENLDFATAFGAIYREYLGLDNENATLDTVKDSVSDALAKNGYVTRRSKYKQIGLEDAGETGYYIDLSKNPDEEGYYVSSDEALKRYTKETKRYVVKIGDKEQAVYNVADYASDEKAKEAAEGYKIYSYQDLGGRKTYFTDQASSESAKAAGLQSIEDYNNKNAIWEYSYTDQYGKPQVRRGTREQLKAFEKQREGNVKQQYAVHADQGGSTVALGYFEDLEKAQNVAYEYNKGIKRTYDEQVKLLKEEQKQATTAEYTDIYGNTFKYKGKDATERAEESRNAAIANNQYLTYDVNGQLIKGYATQELAEQGVADNTAYYYRKNGETILAGYGAEGLAEQNKIKEYYNRPENKLAYINGVNISSYDLAQKILNAEKPVEVRDYNGNPLAYYSDQKSMNLEYFKNKQLDNYLKDIQDSSKLQWEYGLTHYTGRDSSVVTRIKIPGYTEDGFVNINKKGQAIDAQGNVIKGSYRGAINEEGYIADIWDKYRYSWSYADKNKLNYSEREIDKSPIFWEEVPIIKTLQDAMEFFGEVETFVPDLKLPEMGSLAQVTGEAVSKMNENIIAGATDLVEEVTTIISDNLNPSTSNLKAVKDYFLSGSAYSYNAWLTDKNNAYATTVDNMIRMMQGQNTAGLSSVQKTQNLLRYVDRNEVKEWNNLYQNSEFGRIMSQIKRNEYGYITYAPEDIYEQIENFLYSNGRDYVKKEASFSEKTEAARRAYVALTSPQFDANGNPTKYYLSQEARDNDIAEAYRLAVTLPDEEAIQEEYEKLGPITSATLAEKQAEIYSRHINQRMSLDEYADKNGIKYMSDLEEGYLKEILGENLARDVINNPEGLTPAKKKYAETLFNNYQFGITGLTTQDKIAGLKSMMAMTGEEYREQYSQTASDMAMAAAYGEGYSNFTRWQQLMSKEKLTDQEQTELASINQGMRDYLKTEGEKLDFRWASDKNASKLMQNYTTLLEGSLTDRLAMLQPYMSQNKTYANAQAILNSGVSTAEDRRALASVLGLEDSDVKELVKSDKGKTQLQNMLNDKTGKLIEEVAKSFNVDLTSDNWMAQLRGAASLKGEEVSSAIDSLLDSLTNVIVDAEGHVISAGTKEGRDTKAGDYYISAEEEYEAQTRTARAAAWFKEHRTEIDELAINGFGGVEKTINEKGHPTWSRLPLGYEKAISQVAEKYGVKAEDLSTYWANNVIGLDKARQKGLIDSSVIDLYIDAQISGGKYRSELNNALLSNLFKDTFVNGKLDTTQIGKIKEQMIGATEDTESGTYTLWSILASDVSQFADALQLLKDGNYDEAVNALNKAFEEMTGDRIDELLKYVDVSKDFKNALSDLAKGGSDAAVALAKLNAQNEEDFNAMLSAFKIQNKDGTYKAGKDISGKDKTNFLELTGLNAQTLYGMASEEVQYAAEQALQDRAKRIQTEKVAMIKAAPERLDYSKITFDSKGRMDISKATEGLSEDAARYWKDVQSNINDLVNQEGLTISVPALFKLSGYDIDNKSAKDMVNSEEYKKIQTAFTDMLNSLYTGLSKEDLAKITINADLTFDTKEINLEGQQKTLVKEWNKLAKENPFYANLVVSSSQNASVGTTGGASGITVEGIMNEMENNKNWQKTYDAAVAYHQLTGDYAYKKKRTGGGGGQSALTKLLKEIEYQMKQLEHERKMAQIEQATANRLNDRDTFVSAVNNEVAVIEKMKTAQTENIAKMEEQLKKLKESDDQYKQLTEKINAAREALANYNNELAEARAKRIEFIQEQQEEQDKPGTHKQTMLGSYAERALSQDRFSDYVQLTEQKMSEMRTQRTENDAQIEEWKNELKQLEADSDQWREVRDKIYALEEENAELDNQLVQEQLELNQQKLSQIAKILQQDTQTEIHNQNIASTYGNFYQSSGYRNEYENMIREQQKNTAAIIEENKAAEASAREQMDTLEKGSTAWFEAQAAVYQYSEAVAQAELSQIELNKALTQSNIDKINEDYSDQTRELTHVNELLAEQTQEYLELKDNDAYMEAMSRYMDNLSALAGESKEKLDALNQAYQKGMASGTLDPSMQRDLLNQINEAESEYQKFLLEQSKKQREINKVALDQLFEDQDWSASEYDHNIKLVGYETSRYQNNGELTNVNIMIEAENKLRQERTQVLQDEIEELEKQKELFKDDPEQEKRIVEQIKKHEEALEQENTQIDKNNKLLEENQKKIMQVRKTLEDAVDKEIEAEKKRQREILSANVSMQDTIVNLLKKRLQDEWNLKKKDIEKEKENLAEYKNLINERFNYRKKAAEQADKEEEIAELNRQIALISADPTRTKDLKELTRKRDELLEEQGWTIAEDEVSAESERIDDQMEGMDKFVQYNEELLNEILSDANNFATEMNEILSGSFEESYEKILEFMSKENEAFMKSLPDAQKQMIQSWEDTWKKANDIIDSNYQLITTVLSDKDTYMDYMRGIDRTYRLYQENGDENSMWLLEQQWSEYYDNYINSIKNDAEFDEHAHTLTDVVSKIDELGNEVFKVNIIGIDGKAPSVYGLDDSNGKTIDFSNGEGLNLTDLSGLYYVAPAVVEAAQTIAENNNTGGTPKAQDKNNKELVSIADLLTGIVNATTSDILALGLGPLNTDKIYEYEGTLQNADSVTDTTTEKTYNNPNSLSDLLKSDPVSSGALLENKKKNLLGFSGGGYVNYTGLAVVHGTHSKPESFLDATDTKLLRSMLDTFTYVKNSPYMSYIDPSMYNNNTNVGDINITINQAEINSDADVDNLAKRVGQAFTKELQHNGLNLSGYSF